jgi:hypothetical protein
MSKKLRHVREVTAEEENFRAEPMRGFPNISFCKRDPIEPEPIGTVILMAFRITGYDEDCDGSLMARVEQIDCDGGCTGWDESCLGLYPDSSLVVKDGEKGLKTLWEEV